MYQASRPRRRTRFLLATTIAFLVVATAACSSDDTLSNDSANGSTTTSSRSTGTTEATSEMAGGYTVFSGQGNNLDAYEPIPPFTTQRVIHTIADQPDGLDINAQICFFPDGSGRFVAGEDTGQPNPPAGWGIFQLSGTEVGDLEAEEIGKLTPT